LLKGKMGRQGKGDDLGDKPDKGEEGVWGDKPDKEENKQLTTNH